MKKSLVHIYLTPESLINVEKTGKSTILTFNDGTFSVASGVTDFDVDGNDIVIYRAIRNRRHRIPFDLPGFNTQGTSTPLELVQYWKTNNFFFDVSESGSSGPNVLTTYRAFNWTDLTTNVALTPSEGETAYLVNAQGTRWLPGSLGGTHRNKGLWYYDGTEWTNDTDTIEQQLQLNIDDIEAIETINSNQDAAISSNATNISSLSLDKADKITEVTGTNSISGGGDLSANRTLQLVNDLAILAQSAIYGSFNSVKGWFSIPQLVTNNSGQIKLNWVLIDRPESASGFTSGVVNQLPLNTNYSVSSSPTTSYPHLANELIAGENLLSPSTLFLRELLPGQSIIFRVKVGYLNKGASQNGNISIRMYNPNPASSFDITKGIPAPDGTTTYEEEFEFIAIADSLSQNPLYGYAFEAETSFNDGNMIVFISEITAFYIPTDLINKTP